jgi:xylulokinase
MLTLQLLVQSYYLGIDCGTQGLKALVYDSSAKSVVGLGSVAYGLSTNAEGLAEQEPAVWIDAMYDACSTAIDQAVAARPDDSVRSSIRGIGVSGQQHGLVALDDAFNVIRPAKLWCDTQSAPEAEELAAQLGWGIVAGFTATKLLWMKRHEPENFAKLAHVALPHDYLNYVLTDRLVMECGDASGVGLLDTSARAWDGAAAALIDEELLSKLPPLIAPTELAGTLGAQAAERLGLSAGVPVAPGGGDNMMSALGCGCAVTGRVAISLGTSGTIFAKTAAAAHDVSGAICPFLDATGGGLPLLCTLNCASVPEEVRAGYGLSRDEISVLEAPEPVGCEGLAFLPYLVGERTPNWPHASGVLAGIRPGTLSRPGLVYRAALEGVAFSLRDGLANMAEHGLPAGCDEVRLVGGGSKSALWREIVSDALQMRVACPTQPESAALGAALQAAAVVAGAEELGEWIEANHPAPVGEARCEA